LLVKNAERFWSVLLFKKFTQIVATNFRQGVHLKSHSIRETHEERPNFVIEWQQRQGWCLDVCHRVKTCMILKNIIIIFDILFCMCFQRCKERQEYVVSGQDKGMPWCILLIDNNSNAGYFV